MITVGPESQPIDQHSHIYWAEIIPGVYHLVDETAWHPLLSKSYREQPDRPCHPCYRDPRPPAPTHYLDHERTLDTRLRDGFTILGWAS